MSDFSRKLVLVYKTASKIAQMQTFRQHNGYGERVVFLAIDHNIGKIMIHANTIKIAPLSQVVPENNRAISGITSLSKFYVLLYAELYH